MRKLTPKQQKFCDAILSGENYTESARIAGYSGTDNQLSVTGSTNVRKPNIQEYLATAHANSPLVADAKEIQEFWTAILRGDNPEASMKDRLKASEMLAKTQGQFIDRVEHSGAVARTIEYDLTFSKRDDDDEEGV